MRRLGMLLAAPCAVAMLLAGALVFVTPVHAGNLPATGQTTAHQADKNDGIVGPVDIPDDGTLQRGATLHYKVLKDGTVKDLNTGLIWEVKCASGCGGLHDVENTYYWSGHGTQETIWDWLDDINAEGGKGYAKHKDWRIPNIKELQSIVDYGRCSVGCGGNTVAIDPIFGPTAASNYWSSTTFDDRSSPWFVAFSHGLVDATGEDNAFFVRAVRGGPK